MHPKAQWIICTVIFFAPPILTFRLIIPPVHDWLILHTVFTTAEIRDQHIAVTSTTRPHSAVFSNGERHDYGMMPGLIVALLWLSAAGIGLGLVRVLSPLIAPVVYQKWFAQAQKIS